MENQSDASYTQLHKRCYGVVFVGSQISSRICQVTRFGGGFDDVGYMFAPFDDKYGWGMGGGHGSRIIRGVEEKVGLSLHPASPHVQATQPPLGAGP